MTRPLILDVDGTFLKNDLTHEMILESIKRNLLVGLWQLLIGITNKPRMKQHMVARIGDRLLQGDQPTEPTIVSLAKEAKAEGRPVYLCSGSEESLVKRLAAQHDFLDGAFGTSPTYNMTSENKAAFLKDRFPDGFDYAGNSSQDFAVWEEAQLAYGARPPAGTLETRTQLDRPVDILIERPAFTEKLPHLLAGLELWKLVVLLVPLLVGAVLTGLGATQTLNLAAGIAALFLAMNVGRMLRRVQTDRIGRGTAYKGNLIASGKLPVPLAVAAFVGMSVVGLALLASLTPLLSLGAIFLWIASLLMGR
ncbi:MAG: hypothetical protein AAFP97_02995 [Pseudomonadota bacterium]